MGRHNSRMHTPAQVNPVSLAAPHLDERALVLEVLIRPKHGFVSWGEHVMVGKFCSCVGWFTPNSRTKPPGVTFSIIFSVKHD